VHAKSIFASKTFWVNALTLAATILGSLSGVLPPEAAPYVAGVLSVVNIMLRVVTDSPVKIIAD
jgi:hypothetical protein